MSLETVYSLHRWSVCGDEEGFVVSGVTGVSVGSGLVGGEFHFWVWCQKCSACWGSVLGVCWGSVGFKHFPQVPSGFPGFFRSQRGHRGADLQGCGGDGELTREVPFGKDLPEYSCPSSNSSPACRDGRIAGGRMPPATAWGWNPQLLAAGAGRVKLKF